MKAMADQQNVQNTTPRAARCATPAGDGIDSADRPAAVRVVSLSKVIDERPILSGLNFAVPASRCAAVVGANGAGKSTMLKLLATLTRPTHGRLELFGQVVGRDAVTLRQRIGLIGHQPMLYRDLSARENLLLFGRLYGLKKIATRAAELLDRVQLSDRAHDPVGTFSRGMTQRVAIARALMHDPDLLLADEPFAGLDTPSARMLESMLRELRDEGRTVVLVTHDMDQALRLCDQVIVLQRGRLVAARSSAGLTADELLAEIAGNRSGVAAGNGAAGGAMDETAGGAAGALS